MHNPKSPQKQKQKILQNPFHPLDLSAHDLLTVYKRFQASRQVNRNPKQQLPIETIAQLISSLKGCKPSYVQKCMSQALIKNNISWNQFLAFLDQESEVRYKILDWLLHEKAIIKYRYHNEMPFRHKLRENYQNITDINFLTIGEDQLMLAAIDHKKLVLFDLTDKKFELIDSFMYENKKQEVQGRLGNGLMGGNDSIVGRGQLERSVRGARNKNLGQDGGAEREKGFSLNKSSIRSERLMVASDAGQNMMLSSNNKTLDEEAYYKKERKNISALFNLFNQLPFQKSAEVAGLACDKIQNRTLNSGYVNQIRQTFESYTSQKKHQLRSIARSDHKPIQTAKKKLQSLYQQKTTLTYNPYKLTRTSKLTSHNNEPISLLTGNNSKKLNHDRKQKQYHLQSIYEKYCPELQCIGLVYYNMDLVLVKVAREYNKIILEKQDTIKIVSESDYKKNQIIEMIEFYYHRITSKWFIFVLFRNEEIQHEDQPKSKLNNDSFIKGYQIDSTEIKWKGEKRYAFAKKKQEFYIHLGRNQIIRVLSQPEYGLHLITHNGKYLTWKQEYKVEQGQTVYWKKDFEQKFKNSSPSLCYICVSSQLNKSVLGTIKGTIIIYDLFSKQYKLKKISSHPILQIQIKEEKAYILCQNEKIIIYDVMRGEEIQVLSVRNQDKLHEKIDRFTISRENIVCFGSCIRVYEKFVDQSLQQQKFKMENVYTWRLHKLDRSKGQQKPNLKLIPTFRKQKTNAQLLALSDNLFLVITQIQQAIFYSTESLQVKFTTIMDIPHDQKIMRITISPDEKLIAVVLFTQAIYVFNIYTQEEIMQLKSVPYRKYTSISFLDRRNQYLLACGTQGGKIILMPVVAVPEKEPKMLEFHTKSISMLTLKNDILISSSQQQQLAIWQLPYNILRHQIKLKNRLQNPQDHITQKLGAYQDQAFFRAISGIIVQINVSKGEVKAVYHQFVNMIQVSIDVMMGFVIGVERVGEGLGVYVYERKCDKQKDKERQKEKEKEKENGGWVEKKKFVIDTKSEVIGIGIVQSEKAVIFTKTGHYQWIYRNDKISKFKSYLESIV